MDNRLLIKNEIDNYFQETKDHYFYKNIEDSEYLDLEKRFETLMSTYGNDLGKTSILIQTE